jgi:hypothetical protein
VRIAFDVDGVLADTASALACERWLCAGNPGGAIPGDDRADLSTHFGGVENFWESLRELEPGSAAWLDTLAVAQRWHLIFLAVRGESAGASAQVQTQRWLARHGISYPTVLVLPCITPAIAGILELDTLVVATDAWIGGHEQRHTRVMLIDRHVRTDGERTSAQRNTLLLHRMHGRQVQRLDSLASCLAQFEPRSRRARRWLRTQRSAFLG